MLSNKSCLFEYIKLSISDFTCTQNLYFLQSFCADIISVLGMTWMEGRESLKYKIMGSKEKIGSWGHEYVR